MHAHLDQFLRQQIVTQNDRKSQGKRSAVSAASSRRNNALIEQAANMANYRKHNRGQKSHADAASDTRSTASETASQKIITKANTTVMRISGYQADPLAATMQTRSIGLAKLQVDKN